LNRDIGITGALRLHFIGVGKGLQERDSVAEDKACPIVSRVWAEPGFAEKLFLIVLFFLTSGAFIALLQGDDATSLGTRSGTFLTNSIWVAMYIVTAFFLLRECRGAQLSFRKGWLFLAPVGMAILSLAWSDDRGLTFLRCIALIGTTLQSYYVAVRFGFWRILRALAWVGAISMVLCFSFAFFVPRIGIGTGLFEGDWLGIFPHKNSLGSNVALWFLVFLVLGSSGHEKAWAARLAAGISLLLVFLSHSASSLITCVVILAAFWGRRIFSLSRWAIAAGFLGIGVLVNWWFTSDAFADAIARLGRDPSLTGRTEIWALVWIMIVDHPWLGYGYGAFWRGLEGPSGYVWRSFGVPLFYSHNGFLDVWLDVGLVGLLFVLVGFALCFRKAVAVFKQFKTTESMWPMLFLVYLFIANLTEGSLLRVNLLPWLLYMAIALKLAKAVTSARIFRVANSIEDDANSSN
jgi:exopolysaccharide production protein ExoQ